MRVATKTLRGLLVAVVCLTAAPAFAVQPDEILADPALELRARELSRELRCMVCQNQSIDVSDAPLAVLLLGGLGLLSLLRRPNRNEIPVAEQPLTEAERARLSALLDERRSSTPGSS